MYDIFHFDIKWTLSLCLMTLNCLKLGRAVTLMKYLASVVSLIFPPKPFIWNKIMFLISKLLNLVELVVNELTKSISKKFTSIPFSIWFITARCKERDNFKKTLINLAFYLWWTASPRALGMRRLEMKIFEMV